MSRHLYWGILLFFFILAGGGGANAFLGTVLAQMYERESTREIDKLREFDRVIDRLSREGVDRGDVGKSARFDPFFEGSKPIGVDDEEYGELMLLDAPVGMTVPPLPPGTPTWCLTPVSRCRMQNYAPSGLGCRCGRAKGATTN